MLDLKLVKELREKTQAGFLDVKKAVEFSNGNLEKATKWLEENGMAKVAKKANAMATEGVVSIVSNNQKAVMFEVNAQTDFVVKNAEFQNLVKEIKKALISNDFQTPEEALKIKVNEKATVFDLVMQTSVKTGEKIELRKVIVINIANKVLGAYVHNNNQIASVVLLQSGPKEIARNVAMHVASMNPDFLDESQVPEDTMQRLKDKIAKSDKLKNKPDNIKKNIARGMLKKALSEITLLDQEFVMDKMSVGSYLKTNGAHAVGMYRLEVGEGLEKPQTSFSSEVKAQMGK